MMRKYIFVFAIFIHTALTQPPQSDGKVNYKIDTEDNKITYESDLNDQSYAYRLETSDGTIKHESGRFEEDNLIVEGGYEYTGDNGMKYSVTYVADKNGYRPVVSFGSKVVVGTIAPPARPTILPPTTAKGIDPSLIASLIGSGARKRAAKA